MSMSYMCVVAVEMVCLPVFFDRVSAKKHITATFRSREPTQKTVKQPVWSPRKRTLDSDG